MGRAPKRSFLEMADNSAVMDYEKSKDIRVLMDELELLEQIQSERKKERGIQYYIPNPVQLRFHKSVSDLVMLCGANRIGKTTAGAVEIVLHTTRKYPEWYPMERRFFKPIKAVIVVTANSIIEKVIEPKLKAFMPADYVLQWKRVTGGYLNRIMCKDGSTVDILSNEQDDMAFESQDWDFYWGDEPQKERKYQAIKRGLVDRHGRGIMTFTPLIEPWMKEKLVDAMDGKKIDVVTATMRDNLFDIKGNPILMEQDIKDFEDSLPEDVKDTRVYGKFFHLRGMVYTEFSDIHKAEFNYQYPDPVTCVLDPHDRQPHHVIWAFLDRTDDVFIHTELSVHCTVQELARLIRKIEKDNGYKMRRRLIDPNFGKKPLITTGRNMIQELAMSGCGGWCEADDPKDEGHLKVKDYLHFNRKQPISLTNKPKIFFHRTRVPLTIHSIQNYQYEEWVGKIASERDPKEKPKERETHGADVVRYLCMSNPKYKGAEVGYELAESPY